MKDNSFKEILNTAYTLELKGVWLYENLKDEDEIFAQILLVRKSGVELLKGCYDDLKDHKNKENFAKFENIDDNIIRAINYENELNEIYANLANECEDEGLRDVLFRLWATSHNEYIPALKLRLQNEFHSFKDDKECNQEESKNYEKNEKYSFEELSKILEKISSGKGSKEDIATLLNSPHISFFGGLALGGLAGVFLNNFIKKEDQTNE